jgi:hypothetical protein
VHIVGISKTAYALATPRCLEWRRAPPPTNTTNPSNSHPLEPSRRLAGRHRGDRRSSRLSAAGVIVLDGVLILDGDETYRPTT